MKQVLVTGGTVFVSRYVAEYYVQKGYQVYVLNRNHHVQSKGVTLIQGDRKKLGDCLKKYHFDVVFDINAYDEQDIHALLDGLGHFDDYIFISSSAVYPENTAQPFRETAPIGRNRYWGSYGMGKIAAEQALLKRVAHAYILRPPYLYGPMNNVYREAFVFECALRERKFYVPKNGEMKLQFFHVHDLCRFMDILMETHPCQHLFNVGNNESITVNDWVKLCYQTLNREVELVHVDKEIDQRKYFSFYDYEYALDVSGQSSLMKETISMADGLKDALAWYLENRDAVCRKAFIDFIDANLRQERNDEQI